MLKTIKCVLLMMNEPWGLAALVLDVILEIVLAAEDAHAIDAWEFRRVRLDFALGGTPDAPEASYCRRESHVWVMAAELIKLR